MLDPVDTFIVREMNKADKIVAAILASAIYSRQENNATQQETMEQIIELWAMLLVKMQNKELSTLG